MILCLQALLRTVEREEREMRELDSAKDALINLCTPGGRHALTLETAHLHDLCAASEKEIKEKLVVCETRLADIESKKAERAESLRVQAECILNDLRAQEWPGLVEGKKNISQLQENWNILKVLNISKCLWRFFFPTVSPSLRLFRPVRMSSRQSRVKFMIWTKLYA